MQVSVTDTIPTQQADTIQDTTIAADYFFGNVIPVDSARKSFPDTISTSDGVYAGVYSHYQRVLGEAMPVKSFDNDFGFGILSFSLLILALLMALGRKVLMNSLSSLKPKHSAPLASQSAIGVLSWAPILSNLFSVINCSLFLILSAATTGMIGFSDNFETIKIAGIAFAALFTVMFIRHLLCRIIGAVSGQKEAFREYLSVIYAVWFLAGLTFFFLSVLILFTPVRQPEVLVWIGAGVFVLLYFYRIIRLLIIFLKQHVTILYFILYLCALEVLPVLIIIKVFGAF
jgi:hypothetical protein